jgi:hypothetical protein
MTDRDKRMLTIGGVIVAVAVVGFLLFNVLGGGGTPKTSRTPRPTSTAASGPDTGTPTLAPSPVLVLPARDPFSIPPGFNVSGGGTTTSGGTTSGGGTSSGGGSTSTATTPGGSSSTSTQTPGGPTGGGGGGGGNGASQTIGGHTVTLLDAFSAGGVERADVDVDGQVYHPSVGESFGPNKQYRLQSVSGNCATFLYGDESFTLCVAQNK